jgi:hypothetical protein
MLIRPGFAHLFDRAKAGSIRLNPASRDAAVIGSRPGRISIMPYEEDEDWEPAPTVEAYEPPSAAGRRAIIKRVAGKRRTITMGGKKVRMSNLKLLLNVIRTLAIKGDVRFGRLADRLRSVADGPKQGGLRGLLITGEKYTTEEFKFVFAGGVTRPHEEFVRHFKARWDADEAAYQAMLQAKKANAPK